MVMEAIAEDRQRILLTLATGTGKTFIAFQISWKLFHVRWNLSREPSRRPRILFLADRNILANQAYNAFSAFPEDAMVRIAPADIRKKGEPDVKIKIFYTRKGDNLKMGEAQIDKIEYGFWKGKFAEGYITSTGSENFNQLKKFLFEKYGTVDKSAQGLYSWNGPVTRIALRYDEPTKTSLLTISSTTITFKEIFDKD